MVKSAIIFDRQTSLCHKRSVATLFRHPDLYNKHILRDHDTRRLKEPMCVMVFLPFVGLLRYKTTS